MSQRNFDFVIIGGGVVGLAIAREIKLRDKNKTVAVLEKESDLGLHASGRNSGVIHAGFYYSPDSLKAKLTRQGNVLLHEFLTEKNVAIKNVGKVVVTTNESQLKSLEELYQRGLANGVPLEIINEAELGELEPNTKTVKKALWSPSTSVADPKSLVTALKQDLEFLKVEILLSERVIEIENNSVKTEKSRYSYGHLINAAGLYADKIAHKLGFGLQYDMLPFKGLYWYAPKLKNTIHHHIYPVPDPRNPFLGVHLTVTVSGDIKIGPTAIPAFWREDYGSFANFKLPELFQVLADLPRFLVSPHHKAWSLVASEMPKYSRKYLVKQAKKLVPALDQKDFNKKGQIGVRAQLFDKKAKRLEMDFVVEADENSTHVLNAVSPAWTTSLSFAKHVVENYLKI
ncbi:MAG: L-2-hydroxyglutarate oxidase [Candidatus Nanopelagicales bacterium]